MQLSGNREVVYAWKADGTLWKWGRDVALGGGAAVSNQMYVTHLSSARIPKGVTAS